MIEMQDFLTSIQAVPSGVWVTALLISIPGNIWRYRRLQRRRRERYPFRDMNPTRSAITCPRCHAPWPGGYEPRSHRELMWKGVVCPGCGCEYDDRGRERTVD
jgi:hypothetical protein